MSTPLFGPTNPDPATARASVKRIASVNRLRPGKEQLYRELHADVWPAILERLRTSHIRNYSIYLKEVEGTLLLFSYFEYTGQDFEADMQAIADDPETRRWWKLTDPCQQPLPDVEPGGNWSDLEPVFLME